jgi:hypothetical protein
MSNIFPYSDKKLNFVIRCYKKEVLKIQPYFQKVMIYFVDLNALLFLISVYNDQDLKYVT